MLAGLLCVLALAGAWLVARVGPSGAIGGQGGERSTLRGRLLWAAAVLAASVPVMGLLPSSASPAAYWGDLPSHARVAAELARTGLPRGWIESYLGGFPFGHHYPTLGWALLAGLIRLGCSPEVAANILGFGATVGFFLALYFGLIRCGVGSAFACLGATVLGWVSPYNAFVGGYETFYSAGLISQVLAMPICTWLVVATLCAKRRWEVPTFAWLAMASHPQVTVATVAVLSLAAVASWRSILIVRSLWTGAFALLAGVALYGQGIAALAIPFGWPPDLGWRQLGFPPERLGRWFIDGELLDAGREPVTTALLAAACLVLMLSVRRPASRSCLVALLASVVLAVSGRWLQSSGAIGAALLSFLQPLRVISLVPPLVAVAIAVAVEQAAIALQGAVSRTNHARLARAVPNSVLLLGFVVAGFGFPARLRYSQEVRAARSDRQGCGAETKLPEGFDRDRVLAWVASLSKKRL